MKHSSTLNERGLAGGLPLELEVGYGDVKIYTFLVVLFSC